MILITVTVRFLFNSLRTFSLVILFLLLKKYFSQFTFSKKQLAAISAYNSVTPGDFGTLASRIRFMQKDAVTADYIIKELIAQQKEKDNENNRRIGFNCE